MTVEAWKDYKQQEEETGKKSESLLFTEINSITSNAEGKNEEYFLTSSETITSRMTNLEKNMTKPLSWY
jgi:hypothetical protein